jgi:hypothetical protein
MKKKLLTALLALLTILGIHTATVWAVDEAAPVAGEITSLEPVGEVQQGKGWEITAVSGPSEIALAQHLKKTGATLYSAYWCSHCYRQLQLFGKEAATTKLKKVECVEDGENAKPALCKKAKIQGYPTWIIRGKSYPGVQKPEKLAQLSRYKGPQKFKYSKLLEE